MRAASERSCSTTRAGIPTTVAPAEPPSPYQFWIDLGLVADSEGPKYGARAHDHAAAERRMALALVPETRPA